MVQADLFDIMYSTRSMRRLKPDPVPDELIYRVLDAAIRAASGGNTQHWRFVVVKDPAVKTAVQRVYQKGWEQVQSMYQDTPGPDHMKGSSFQRLLSAAAHLAAHLAEAPVLVFACLKSRPMPSEELAAKLARLSGSSIYPAVQNMLLACRALGLGATLTTVCSLYEEELRDVLKLPDDVATYALLPIGYPAGRFGPVRRMPVEEVTCVDQWGRAYHRP